MLSLKEWIANVSNALKADYVVEQGTTNGWEWRKWNSGRYEAERVRNVGQITISNQLVTGIRASAAVSLANPPHTLTSGSLAVIYMGNASNSGCWCEMVGNSQYRLVKAIGSNVTLQGNIFKEMVVAGRWK